VRGGARDGKARGLQGRGVGRDAARFSDVVAHAGVGEPEAVAVRELSHHLIAVEDELRASLDQRRRAARCSHAFRLHPAADTVARLEDENVDPTIGQFGRSRETREATPDDDHPVHSHYFSTGASRTARIGAVREKAKLNREHSLTSDAKRGEGSAGAPPSLDPDPRARVASRGVKSLVADVEFLEARLAAVGGEVDGALWSVVGHERVAV
jgi:hypothetical protein